MKMKKYGSFDEYFADQSPKNRSIIRTLRTFVKRVAPGLQESVKWGNGCWIMGSVPVAYVYSAPDYVQFGFFRGSGLKDPQQILEGKPQGWMTANPSIEIRWDLNFRVGDDRA